MRLALLFICVSLLAAVERDEVAYRARYIAMAERAAAVSIPRLYYNQTLFSPNHQALMRVRDPLIQGVLVDLYARTASERDRWNLLVVLIHREHDRDLGDSRAAILRVAIQGLHASDEWLKTESIWGVGLFGDRSHIPLIEEARNDLSDVVADEAERTLKRLRRIVER